MPAMNKTNQIVKNVSFNWAGMALGMVLSFIQAPIVVLALGNTWYGIWVLLNQLTAYTWLFDLGIREGVVRYVAKHHIRKEFGEINEIVSTAIYLYLLISFLTIAVISALVILLPYFFKLNSDVVGVARVVLFVSGLNIAISWFFNTYTGILMGLQRFDIANKIWIGIGVVNFVLVITFIKAGYGIIALALIGFSASMLGNILGYWQCRRLFPELKVLRLTWQRMRFRLLINYGKYVFLNNIGTKIIFGADALIIGIFLPVSAITFYAIPGTLINMLRNLVSSATWILNPLFSELESKGDMVKIKSILQRGTKFSLLLGLPVAIVYLIMGKNFISLWIGKEYGEGSSLVLIVLTIATLFTLFHHTVHSALFGISRHNIIAYLRIGEAAGKILLCVIFVKILGIVGVALGTAISHVLFMGLLLPFLARRSLGISIRTYLREAIIPPVLTIIPFAACCYSLNQYLPANSLLGFFTRVAAIMPVFLICAWYISFSKIERNAYLETACRYIPALRFLAQKGIARL